MDLIRCTKLAPILILLINGHALFNDLWPTTDVKTTADWCLQDPIMKWWSLRAALTSTAFLGSSAEAAVARPWDTTTVFWTGKVWGSSENTTEKQRLFHQEKQRTVWVWHAVQVLIQPSVLYGRLPSTISDNDNSCPCHCGDGNAWRWPRPQPWSEATLRWMKDWLLY